MEPLEHWGICPNCGYDMRVGSESHVLPAGTVLQGQYLVGKVLGQGGFGITYMGWDVRLNTSVAIKEYYPNGMVMRDCTYSLRVTNCVDISSTLFEGNRKRFLREARSLAQLSHIPEVVHVRNFFEENNTAYIIMEYLSGRTLKDYVRGLHRTLTLQETFKILQPVMRGLSKVHGHGIVHRDISPDNIMLTRENGVKLLDFGAVRDVREAGVDKELTKSTETILKQGYAPMEQYQKKGTLGPWTDVYALCATIYWCLTGSVPPDAPGLLMEETEIPWDQIPGLTAAQTEVLVTGTQLLPRNRIRSMEELEQKLTEALTAPANAQLQKQPAAVKKAPPETVSKPVPKKGLKGKTVLICAAAILLLAGTFLLGRSLGTPETETEPNTISAAQTASVPPETGSGETLPEEPAETQEAPAEKTGTPLSKLECKWEYGKVSYGAIDDVLGNHHDDAMVAKLANRKDPGRIVLTEYYLNGSYTEFSGTLSCGEETEAGAEVAISVRLDGKLLMEMTQINRETNHAFSVDVTGGKVLRIECTAARNTLSQLVIDGVVTGSGETLPEEPTGMQEAPVEKTGKTLSELECKSEVGDVAYGACYDAFGNHHDDALIAKVANLSDPGWVVTEYYLNGSYTDFSGVIACAEESDPDAEMSVSFRLDGVLLLTVDHINRETNRTFSLDVTDGKILRVHCTGFRSSIGQLVVDGVMN